jgi:hypothetical protein
MKKQKKPWALKEESPPARDQQERNNRRADRYARANPTKQVHEWPSHLKEKDRL